MVNEINADFSVAMGSVSVSIYMTENITQSHAGIVCLRIFSVTKSKLSHSDNQRLP